MPIGIMGSKSLALIDRGSRYEQEGRRNYEYTRMSCFLLQA